MVRVSVEVEQIPLKRGSRVGLGVSCIDPGFVVESIDTARVVVVVVVVVVVMVVVVCGWRG